VWNKKAAGLVFAILKWHAKQLPFNTPFKPTTTAFIVTKYRRQKVVFIFSKWGKTEELSKYNS
jgi:hypothetical protein